MDRIDIKDIYRYNVEILRFDSMLPGKKFQRFNNFRDLTEEDKFNGIGVIPYTLVAEKGSINNVLDEIVKKTPIRLDDNFKFTTGQIKCGLFCEEFEEILGEYLVPNFSKDDFYITHSKGHLDCYRIEGRIHKITKK
ncbi:hypothetical protein KY321_01965 [Candidatus Woesearchaeota archaeon]|nr:hypothetical protein [Candidatus Woesearchaeota archaeon]